MPRATCKTIICAIGNLDNFKEKDFRKAFQNPEIANAVAADIESQQAIWTLLEGEKIKKPERRFLANCLKVYTE